MIQQPASQNCLQRVNQPQRTFFQPIILHHACTKLYWIQQLIAGHERSLPVDREGRYLDVVQVLISVKRGSLASTDGYRPIPCSRQYPVSSPSCPPIVPFSPARLFPVLSTLVVEIARVDSSAHIPVKWLENRRKLFFTSSPCKRGGGRRRVRDWRRGCDGR